MTKMKKLFAVVLALAMLLTMASFSASAETTPTVTVSAVETVEEGKTLEVTVTPAGVGGVDGVLNYDNAKFDYQSAVFTNEAVNTDANSLKDNGNGSLKLVLVDGTATLTFEAKEEVEGAAFTFVVNAASNEDGTVKYETNDVTCVPATVTVTAKENGIKMLGATIRSTNEAENQDLGFIGLIEAPEGAEIVEFGMIAAFTNDLKNNSIADADFTLDTVTALNVEGKKVVAHKAITSAALIESVEENNGLFTSHIKGTDSYAFMGKNITARFYAKFKIDGTEQEPVYSENTYVNYKDVTTAENGVSKRSIVKVLGSLIDDICKSTEANDEIKAGAETVVNNYNNRDKSDETAVNDAKQALLDFVNANQQYLPESELER